MVKKKFKFPDFNKMSYKEEAEWWDTHSFADYWDELEDVDIVVELEKPRDETVILRVQKDIKERMEKFARFLLAIIGFAMPILLATTWVFRNSRCSSSRGITAWTATCRTSPPLSRWRAGIAPG